MWGWKMCSPLPFSLMDSAYMCSSSALHWNLRAGACSLVFSVTLFNPTYFQKGSLKDLYNRIRWIELTGRKAKRGNSNSHQPHWVKTVAFLGTSIYSVTYWGRALLEFGVGGGIGEDGLTERISLVTENPTGHFIPLNSIWQWNSSISCPSDPKHSRFVMKI